MTKSFSTNDPDYWIELEDDVIQHIFAKCRDAGRFEVGGVLIGRYSDNRKVATIMLATDPPDGSKATTMSFERGAAGLAESLAGHWQVGMHYLGEWHYHPSGSGLPSNQDLTQMFEISSDLEYDCPVPILGVTSGSGGDVHVQFWIIKEGHAIRVFDESICRTVLEDA